MSAEPLGLSAEGIDAFLAATIEDDTFAVELADRTDLSRAAAGILLSDLASEARLACRLLATLRPTRELRMLEVGAGAGVAAAFLHREGADLFAIEPFVGGFEPGVVVRALLAERVEMPPIEPLAAEQLDPTVHGHFALIFSVNVLEHMRPLHRNLDAIASVLAPGGRMIHTCPNYRVPYEPHYRIPLVPGWPALTGLVARRARRDPAWESLNWITAGDIRRFACRHDLGLQWQAGQLTAAIERLRADDAFARRQRGPVTVAAGLLDSLGLMSLLDRLPAAFVTPMTFTLTKPAGPPPRPSAGSLEVGHEVGFVRSSIRLTKPFTSRQVLGDVL